MASKYAALIEAAKALVEVSWGCGCCADTAEIYAAMEAVRKALAKLDATGGA